MSRSIECWRLSHMNAVVEDFSASVDHFTGLFGGVFLVDLPGPHWHACLIEIGGVIIELFAPSNFMLNSRHGAHYLGVEYEADVPNARVVCAAQGVRIMRDIDLAFHTNPADGFGLDYEFYGESFFTQDNKYLTTMTRPISFWKDEHPLGLCGPHGYTQVVSDLEAASRFIQDFVGAEPLYEAERPALAARAAGFRVSDAIIEILAPTGDGALRRELEIQGQGIRSTVFKASSIDKVKGYFAERGVDLVAGTLPDSLAIPAAANRGLMFEFVE